ncbi:MAG: ATP-grasp domain-containing protein [Cyanobacteria bacterium SIG27]|nr:ATP-grasp domain-containing protein [Cyanobacteria bacterium SIG27]
MFILNNPYVSDFLVETIKKNKYSVLDNEISRHFFDKDELTTKGSDEKFYSNSENAIDWIIENYPNSPTARMIKLSKDKILFRKMLSRIYPNYFFKEITLEEFKNLDPKSLKYPFILKPSVGFLSFGVYPIKNEDDFKKIILKIDEDINNFKDVFPTSVVNCSKFIIEEMIEGDEYALDAYFDENGKAVILNIFKHPFFDENDVSDRIYYTSKKIIQDNLEKFQELLDDIGEIGGFRNYPFHLELRANKKEVIPIEINPLRFCGWCITDIAQNAWGINVYEYYMENKIPNWDEILKNASDDYFYFTIGDVDNSIDKSKIKINYEKYLKNISNPLVIRKIDYKTKPVFAIVFAKTNNKKEIEDILALNMKDFIEEEKQ